MNSRPTDRLLLAADRSSLRQLPPAGSSAALVEGLGPSSPANCSSSGRLTNALKHGWPPIRLVPAEAGPGAEDADSSPTSRCALGFGGHRARTRLIKRLTYRWGTRPTSTGKIVWVEQRLHLNDTLGETPPRQHDQAVDHDHGQQCDHDEDQIGNAPAPTNWPG